MAESKNHFEFKEDGDNKLHVLMDGKKITTFYYNDFELANRPFLYPIKAPCEEQVTRGYPIEEIEGETKDHIHHTSVWTAWGRVNRIDNWAYGEKNGRQVVKSIQTSNKEDKGIIDLKIQWTTPNGKLQLKENRKICFHASKKPFIIDFDIALTASAGKIKFKDTKEGGFLATRVATSMDVRNGGKIENSNGKV